MSPEELTVTEPAAAEAAEAPKKRTVRRTRKTAASDTAAAAETEAKPAPKRRTRKTAATAADAEATETEAAPKKRATRTRTTKTAAAKDASATDEEQAKPAPKRRTRKTASAPEGEDAVAKTAASEAAGGEDEQAERPRRRTRRTVTMITEPPVPLEKPSKSTAASEASTRSGADADKEEQARSGEGTRVTVRRQRARLARPSGEGSSETQASGAQQEKPRPGRGMREQQRRNQQNNHNGAKNNGNHQNNRQNNNHNSNQQQNKRNQRRNQHERSLAVPKTSLEDVAAMKVAELRARADELGVEHEGLKKQELIALVYDASVRAEGFLEVEGVLDILQDGYGFLRTEGYLPGENDVYVGASLIRRNNLRKGDMVKGQTRPARDNDKYAALQQIHLVNGRPPEEAAHRPRFGDLTPIFPDEVLKMEHGHSTITARVIDLVSPIGKGQRGLIVSPPKAGKTTVLKDIAAAITANNPEVHLMCLLVDERPEEVTDMQRSIKGEVIASTFDMPTENHITVSELVIERAKRLVEQGEDVVILLDSLTRLARAYNLAQPASGRILSGGVDSMALYPPKRFLGAARNIEHGGSLTILASALIETGSKMDEVIFEEFKGTGNMELKLDRNLADRRIFPAIDPVASGTRREDLLLDPQEAPLIWAVRRVLANMNNTERAMDMLIKSLRKTENNREFLIRAAKKAQSSRNAEVFEL